jgi:glyoxalase family protein
MAASPGLHHITAICSDGGRIRDFYERVLGLRLVKRTVNYDDPQSWHLYFGDRLGKPGTLLTFFEWPDADPGRPGTGEAVSISLAIPKGAAHGWVRRLTEEDIRVAIAPGGDDALAFHDPDGLALELIEQDWAQTVPGYTTEDIGEEQAIRGLAGVTILAEDIDATANLIEEAIGWKETARASHQGLLRLRYSAPGTSPAGGFIDLLKVPDAEPGEIGVGSIHHIAFRASDDIAQGQLGAQLTRAGLDVTQVRDRTYFRSIYAREASGLLIEIATDAPGFLVDEDEEALGARLQLPKMLESQRDDIEENLPELY